LIKNTRDPIHKKRKFSDEQYFLRIATENGGRMMTWKFMKMNRGIHEDEQASFTDVQPSTYR
jgi:hypothetical protein